MAPLEPWEKVFVNKDKYSSTVHGQFQCTYCHAGNQSPDMEIAHKDMNPDPSTAGKDNVCATCHQNEEEHFSESLHASLNGYWEKINTRSIPENHPALEEMFGNHCSTCHTSCGDCHISQPKNVGGGLVDGHIINKTPSMSQNCTACHGSRVGAEYLGKHEGIPGDAHFRLERMNCMSCHTGDDMHDSTGACKKCHNTPELEKLLTSNSRYAGAQIPSCESCHEDVGKPGDANPQHLMHGNKLACQVCHSIQYTSCDSCHVAISQKTGKPFYETQSTYFTF